MRGALALFQPIAADPEKLKKALAAVGISMVEVSFCIGDDARFEGIYKFVMAAPYNTSNHLAN